MFERAGFEEFSHRIQQRKPGTPRAITTLAYVPDEESVVAAETEVAAETDDPVEV
jgi:demethylmenaquinone methyltransferase/2-methoxy-6-polyprenyl-1,4-benzoquinol methylase